MQQKRIHVKNNGTSDNNEYIFLFQSTFAAKKRNTTLNKIPDPQVWVWRHVIQDAAGVRQEPDAELGGRLPGPEARGLRSVPPADDKASGA